MPDADITELRDLFAHDTAEWKPIRDEGTKDMRHVAGDPWEPRDRELREKVGRPVLSLDELSQYINQVINEVRANKRAVKFSPVGNGANDETAAFYADKMREIEYRSRAQIGYTTAFENAVQRSYGFVRVNTRYAHSRAVNQDLWIDPVPNPDLVTPDAEALMPDLSDMTHCWVRERWDDDDFNRKWSKAKIKTTQGRGELMRLAPDWVKERGVFVGEYWKIKTKPRTLLIVQIAAPQPPKSMLGLQQATQPDPVGIFEDELEGQPLPGTLLGERKVDDPTVYQYLTNGLETLEEHTWPGKYIPIIGCFGKVLYVDAGGGAKRKILSMVRLARDPYMLYCYYRTCEAELVGMTPKFPYFVYEGQLAPVELNNLAKSLHEPVAVIKVKPTIEGLPSTLGPLPFPQRQPYEPPIQALEFGAEAARRAIQAAMGQSPLPTMAQRKNEKSGVALKQIEETGQRGSFHFTDHYLDMLTHVGVVTEDLMDKIYDSARDVGIRKANDTAEVVRINDPSRPKSVSTKGDHLVTVSTGPSFDSEREAASDFADVLAQISPETFMLLGPLIVKLKNLGPIGDEIAELLEAMQPPQVQQLRAAKGEQADPAQQVQAERQKRQAIEQQVELLSKELTERVKQIETEQVKQAAARETKAMELKAQHQLQVELQEMKNAATIRVAEINAAVKGYVTEAQHAARHEEQALNIRAEAVQSDLEREQASAEAEHQRQHEAESRDVDLQFQREQVQAEASNNGPGA